MNSAQWLWWGILAGMGLPAAYGLGMAHAERIMTRADAESDPAALPAPAESLRSRPLPGEAYGTATIEFADVESLIGPTDPRG